MAKRSYVETVAIFSDTHAGSTVGLCGALGPELDDGQVVQPSKLQQWLWERYLRYWQRVRAVHRQNRGPLRVVVNGDVVDGPNHHGTTQSMSSGKDAQSYIAHSIFEPVSALDPDTVHFVRGTPSHVGGAGGDEEALAASLFKSGKLPVVRDPRTNLWSYWVLRMELNGFLLDFRHHCSVRGLKWTKQGAAARYAFRIWCEHTERGLRAPDIAIRSHVHNWIDSGTAHRTRVLVTPSWQAKSDYAHQKVTEEISDFGGVIITIPPAGPYQVEPVLFPPDEDQPWRPT